MKRRKSFLIAVFLTFCIIQYSFSNYDDLLEKAKSFYQQQKFQVSRELFEIVLQNEPLTFDDEACLMLGNIYDNTGNFKKAIELYQRGIEITNIERKIVFQINLAQAYRHNNENEKSLKLLESIQSVSDKYPEILLYQGMSFFELRKKNDTIKVWEAYLVKIPNGEQSENIRKAIAYLKDPNFIWPQDRNAENQVGAARQIAVLPIIPTGTGQNPNPQLTRNPSQTGTQQQAGNPQQGVQQAHNSTQPGNSGQTGQNPNNQQNQNSVQQGGQAQGNTQPGNQQSGNTTQTAQNNNQSRSGQQNTTQNPVQNNTGQNAVQAGNPQNSQNNTQQTGQNPVDNNRQNNQQNASNQNANNAQQTSRTQNESDRLRIAEETAKIEAERRKIAEENARIEAEKRRIAEQNARIEEERRKLAEQNAKIEAERRKIAEENARAEANRQRIAELQRQQQQQEERERKLAAELKKQQEQERLRRLQEERDRVNMNTRPVNPQDRGREEGGSYNVIER